MCVCGVCACVCGVCVVCVCVCGLGCGELETVLAMCSSGCGGRSRHVAQGMELGITRDPDPKAQSQGPGSEAGAVAQPMQLVCGNLTPQPHRVRQRITHSFNDIPHHAPVHVWGWNPSTFMVAHMHFSVNTTIDIHETHFGAL